MQIDIKIPQIYTVYFALIWIDFQISIGRVDFFFLNCTLAYNSQVYYFFGRLLIQCRRGITKTDTIHLSGGGNPEVGTPCLWGGGYQVMVLLV